MAKQKVKLHELADDKWYSLHEAADYLGITSKRLLEVMKQLDLLRYTLFSSYTILSNVQIEMVKQAITKGDHK